jgi:hypothetical protein
VVGRPFTKGNNTHQNKPRQTHKAPAKYIFDGLVKQGRPSTYQDTYPQVVERLRLLMMTKEEMAKFFGVDADTLDDWARRHEDFNRAYSEGGEIADAHVINALRHRAMGYSHEAEKIMLGPGGQVIREKYTQHYPPSEAAMGLWLSNRQKGRWKLKFDGEPVDDGTTKIVVSGGLPDD